MPDRDLYGNDNVPNSDDFNDQDEGIFTGSTDSLPEDYDSPAAPADDIPPSEEELPDDHPLTDSGVDSHELYDEGETSATDVDAQDGN